MERVISFLIKESEVYFSASKSLSGARTSDEAINPANIETTMRVPAVIQRGIKSNTNISNEKRKRLSPYANAWAMI